MAEIIDKMIATIISFLGAINFPPSGWETIVEGEEAIVPFLAFFTPRLFFFMLAGALIIMFLARLFCKEETKPRTVLILFGGSIATVAVGCLLEGAIFLPSILQENTIRVAVLGGLILTLYGIIFAWAYHAKRGTKFFSVVIFLAMLYAFLLF